MQTSKRSPGYIGVVGSNKAVVVTPNDSADLTGGATLAIYIGGSGNVKADMADGSTVTFNALSVGIVHPLSVRRVYATGTTATNIVGLY
ncbi:spike base protein, RCAP_Rcc01079 family [Paenibacillus rigui]|uniref:Uncharacterized protein n=1 Tax=Paenibacillus rigui TaxID=554312 RepID=A0A229UKP3_9BACL|nr:hypothetical protein [Paenibacillus rigui]OXM83966.1 hypothetical protein CF651_22905 [Paenibacillus rigui]